ncbi:MAG: protein translocase subunit SecF [Burkholderiales bacterium]|nr:protein translocase subunit SecF [Burkholderiales bacterium]
MVARSLRPDKALAFMAAIQKAFYANNRDTTDAMVLIDVAAEEGFDRPSFADAIVSPDIKNATFRDFLIAQEAGIRGFPALLASRQAGQYELVTNGWMAVLLVCVGIIGYLWLRFEWKFGLAAVIANMHDVIIILGFFALFQWEFSLPVLAAVLAVLGYSVNESVVVFDRIRENFRKMRRASVPEVINNAITSTMSRTIITHGCTQLMVTSILFFGGDTLFHFALALTIGILFGIYSSVLVASPLVMYFGIRREDLVRPERKREEAVV